MNEWINDDRMISSTLSFPAECKFSDGHDYFYVVLHYIPSV